jgi:hypothetical protein
MGWMDRTTLILEQARIEIVIMQSTPLSSFAPTSEKVIELDDLVEGQTAAYIGVALQAEVDTIKSENRVNGDVRFYMGPNGLTAYWTPADAPCETAQKLNKNYQETLERRRDAIRVRAQKKLESACKALGINAGDIK